MKVGVIGAGTMGTGIATAFAEHPDYEVCLCDINELIAGRGKKRIAARLSRYVEKGNITEEEKKAILGRIVTGTKYICEECDLVVEAVPEDMETKKGVFKELAGICKKDCIFASNTSSLSVTEMGPDQYHPVTGMHFFNPVPVMKLVEIVVGVHTPQETADKLSSIAESIGKTPIQMPEFAGFTVDRILVPMINEAIGLLAENDISPADIDRAMVLGANHPMGPLALGDLCGLDIILKVMQVLQEETGDPKYRPHPLLIKMVRGGKLGRKSGEGFYKYDKE